MSQRAKIVALGLDLRAACIVVTSERGPEWHKPSTLAFAHVQSELGVRASDCIYVADNPRKIPPARTRSGGAPSA